MATNRQLRKAPVVTGNRLSIRGSLIVSDLLLVQLSKMPNLTGAQFNIRLLRRQKPSPDQRFEFYRPLWTKVWNLKVHENLLRQAENDDSTLDFVEVDVHMKFICKEFTLALIFFRM
ncbi:hypothetical protein CLF_101792 [Clonorchis sinensis]|uniref:Uncharacterized protein n=1 Tax=Clonorchis sinensis TaxID=79923 RepID=G7Y6K7_CLOSI|nr:hypothetical protein CLF_101792 [Clonorchis sinensis]